MDASNGTTVIFCRLAGGDEDGTTVIFCRLAGGDEDELLTLRVLLFKCVAMV